MLKGIGPGDEDAAIVFDGEGGGAEDGMNIFRARGLEGTEPRITGEEGGWDKSSAELIDEPDNGEGREGFARRFRPDTANAEDDTARFDQLLIGSCLRHNHQDFIFEKK